MSLAPLGSEKRAEYIMSHFEGIMDAVKDEVGDEDWFQKNVSLMVSIAYGEGKERMTNSQVRGDEEMLFSLMAAFLMQVMRKVAESGGMMVAEQTSRGIQGLDKDSVDRRILFDATKQLMFHRLSEHMTCPDDFPGAEPSISL